MRAAELIRAGEACGPHRFLLDEGQWHFLAAHEAPLPFLGLWGEDGFVHALFLDGERPLIASTVLIGDRYHALSPQIAGASVHERLAQDLWGAEPMGALNDAPLIEHGGWAASRPASARALALAGKPATPAAGQKLGGIPLARITARPFGAGLASVTPLAGQAHRGVLARLAGCSVEEALRVVGRISGAGFVAWPLAFVRAVERARGQQASPALRRARACLGEIERIAVHLFDLERIADHAGDTLCAAHAAQTREAVAVCCAQGDLPRRLADLITLRGVRGAAALAGVARSVAGLVSARLVYLEPLTIDFAQSLAGAGYLGLERAHRHAIGGLVGRASGRAFDLRRWEAGFDPRVIGVGGWVQGDARARIGLRCHEIAGACRSLEGMADGFDAPDIVESASSDMGEVAGGLREGLGWAESARGDLWAWVRLESERVVHCWLRDPGLALWPVMPDLLRGAEPDLAGVIATSLGWSMSGMEL